MVGGVESYVMLLATGLAQRASEENLQVTLATAASRVDWDDAALPFQVLRKPGLRALVKAIRAVDVVHLAGPCLLPISLGLAFGKPVIIEHHGYQAICPNGMLLCEPTKTICPGHFEAHRYDKCITCNAATVGWIENLSRLLLTFPRHWLCTKVKWNLPITNHVERRLGLPRSQVVYYGIPDRTSEGTVGERLNEFSSGARTTFAYVGRFVSEKGLFLLLEAAQRLRAAGRIFHLILIGDGPERSQLKMQAEKLGLLTQLTFTGYLRGEALEHALRDVDVVVMPSICEETAGLAAIEQMMRGRLVIAADIGGLGEVVDEAGLKFPPGDVGGLVRCMMRVLDEPSLAQSLGEKARQRALQLFHVQRMVADHIALYRQSVGGPAPAAALSRTT